MTIDQVSLAPAPATSDYPCTHDNCDKKFKSNWALNRHIKTHGGKFYLCNICNQTFNDASNLKRHIKRHKEEGIHVCTDGQCNKKCISASALKLHSRKHTKEKPYKCTTCKKYFAYTSSLYAHMEKIHKINKTNLKAYKQKMNSTTVLSTINKLEQPNSQGQTEVMDGDMPETSTINENRLANTQEQPQAFVINPPDTSTINAANPQVYPDNDIHQAYDNYKRLLETLKQPIKQNQFTKTSAINTTELDNLQGQTEVMEVDMPETSITNETELDSADYIDVAPIDFDAFMLMDEQLYNK